MFTPTFSEATTLEYEKPLQAKELKPFKMPKAKGEKREYVVKVKQDAPFEFETVCGESIEKFKYSSDRGKAENSGKPDRYVIPVFSWSDNQKKAFETRLTEQEKYLYVKKEKKYMVICIKDYIEITPKEDFSAIPIEVEDGGELKP